MEVSIDVCGEPKELWNLFCDYSVRKPSLNFNLIFLSDFLASTFIFTTGRKLNLSDGYFFVADVVVIMLSMTNIEYAAF